MYFSLSDPHIKVSGKRDNVKEAKEKIMSVLDTKVSMSSQIGLFLFDMSLCISKMPHLSSLSFLVAVVVGCVQC